MPVLTDTTVEAEAIQLELLRRASPRRKLEMPAQLNRAAHTLALAGLRQRYPHATPAQLRRHPAGLLPGETPAAQVYGPLPVVSEVPDDGT